MIATIWKVNSNPLSNPGQGERICFDSCLFLGITAAIALDGGGEAVVAATSTTSASDAAALALKTYQNQTAEDIESGRARIDSVSSFGRMDSVTSYGSGGSEEELLPQVRVTSPRRTNRENLPLLRGRGNHHQDYEDIDVESENVFTGKKNLMSYLSVDS